MTNELSLPGESYRDATLDPFSLTNIRKRKNSNELSQLRVEYSARAIVDASNAIELDNRKLVRGSERVRQFWLENGGTV